METSAQPPLTARLTTLAALPIGLAIAAPALIAFNVPPSATFFNQEASFIGWGAALLMLGMALPPRVWPRSTAASLLLFALVLLTVAALSTSLLASLPWSISLSYAAVLLLVLLTVAVAAAITRCGLGDRAFLFFCIGLVVAGILSSAIGVLQIFLPSWPDGAWIAPSGMVGRAVGNLRQPNHLSSLLLWSTIAAAWLGETRVMRKAAAIPFAVLFTCVIFLTGSRTGMIGTFLLAGWGLIDSRLSRSTRITLLLLPFVYAAMWHGESAWSGAGRAGFGAAARAIDNANVTSSRWAIWSNALSLSASHPWLGVGLGEFNFAWTLTPFPGRPNEFFDHTHNAVVNLIVELGWPVGLLVIGLVIAALWGALKNALEEGREQIGGRSGAEGLLRPPGAPPMQRAAFMIVAMIGLHSMLEYPLWYSYFLLPTAFAFGLCLERPNSIDMAMAAAPSPNTTRPFVLASMFVLLASSLAMVDYLNVAAIFAPARDSSLEERVERGQHSVLFAHHADYAAATITPHPSNAMSAFRRAPHYLLDARLLIAWATALNENGDVERARYIAQRLNEFDNREKDQFFAPCAKRVEPPNTLPFQCTPPSRSFTYEDFR